MDFSGWRSFVAAVYGLSTMNDLILILLVSGVFPVWELICLISVFLLWAAIYFAGYKYKFAPDSGFV